MFPAPDYLSTAQPQPFERAVEDTIVRVLQDMFGAPGQFLERALILPGHRESSILAEAGETPTAAEEVERALKGRVVVACYMQEEGEGEESCLMEVSVAIDLGYKTTDKLTITDHDRWVQGIRATLSLSHLDLLRAHVHSLTDPPAPIYLQGISRQGPAMNLVEGSLINTSTVYQVRGFILPVDES